MKLVSPFVAVLPNGVDGSAAREHKVSKNIGQESQFGVQWDSSFGSTSS